MLGSDGGLGAHMKMGPLGGHPQEVGQGGKQWLWQMLVEDRGSSPGQRAAGAMCAPAEHRALCTCSASKGNHSSILSPAWLS